MSASLLFQTVLTKSLHTIVLTYVVRVPSDQVSRKEDATVTEYHVTASVAQEHISYLNNVLNYFYP
jgi:hypothetical protein